MITISKEDYLKASIAVPHGTAGASGEGSARGTHQRDASAGGGCDGTVASWRSGQCQVVPITVEIPFSQIGDFVYHCHILEHEDGGMMAHIRVVANP